MIPDKDIHAGSYTDAEWAALTQDQVNRVQNLRAQAAKHNASALQQDTEPEEETPEETEQETPAQFGCATHNNKKKQKS